MSQTDPISQLQEKFRDSLVERGMDRYQEDSVKQFGDGWVVSGLPKFDDSYKEYRVSFNDHEGIYECSCYQHSYGGSRKRSICSHVMAVMIFRKMKAIEDGLGADKTDEDRDYLGELIDSVWPHESYRANQKEMIRDALECLFEDGDDYYVVSAPTGFGKSPVCYSLAHLMGQIERVQSNGESLESVCHEIIERDDDLPTEDGWYVTPQNILLDQLDSDYGDLDNFGMLKGRAHYSCSESGEDSCSEGPCRYADDLECDGYDAAKEATFKSPVANTNFTMFMIHPQIQHRPGLVVDESHMMPEYVLGQVSVQLREDQLGEWDWEIPEFEEFEEYIRWMQPKAAELANWIELTKEHLKKASNQNKWGKKERKLSKKVDRTQRLYRKLQVLITDWKKHEEVWVIQHNEKYDERKEEMVERVEFQPITPYRFMDGMVFDKSSKAVISSATPPQSDLLGVDESQVTLNEVESEFPPENRPIYYEPVGKMSKSNREENAQKAALKIKKVAAGKTLVHCHTYDFAWELYEVLQAIGEPKDNIIVQRRDEGRNREAYVDDWKESDAQFFLSVNLYDGLDLKDDLCRTNIMCVVPFPYLGDPQVQRRRETEGDRFFNWQTAMRIQQAYGRSTRSKDDWSNFYVIDSNFRWFFNANRELFFDWFQEGMTEW